MGELSYECVTLSCRCLVRGIDSLAGEDLSVVTDGSRFGLIHRDDRGGRIREEWLLPCCYENIYFLHSGPYYTVVTVEAGKLGLFAPQGSVCADGAHVELSRLLAAVYDRFEPLRSMPGLLLCCKGSEISVYDIGDERMSRSYAGIRERSDNYFLAWDDENYFLCSREGFREAYRMDSDVLCTFAGKWVGGDVYMLRDTDFCKRLLFCDRYGENIRLSPIAREIGLRGCYEDEKYFVTGISMEWGTRDEILDESVILDIMDVEEKEY